MEPITLIIAASGITLVAGAYLFKRKKSPSNKQLIKEAKARADKRAAERALIGDATDDFDLDFSTNSISVKQHGKSGLPLDNDQVKAINLIFGGAPLSAKHRPVFLIGKSAQEAANVPIKDTAYGDSYGAVEGDIDFSNPDYSTRVDVEYLEPDYDWKEKYDKKEKVRHVVREETQLVSPDFIWPAEFKKAVNE